MRAFLFLPGGFEGSEALGNVKSRVNIAVQASNVIRDNSGSSGLRVKIRLLSSAIQGMSSRLAGLRVEIASLAFRQRTVSTHSSFDG
jgi:hypothetical protein